MARVIDLRSDGLHLCTPCGVLKPVAEFYLNAKGHPARHLCKSCTCTQNHLKRVARGWQKRVATPESVERRRLAGMERLRKWNEAHPERVKELRRASAKRFAENKPERVAAYGVARRQRCKTAAFTGHETWIRAIYSTAKGLGLTVDHVIPLRGKNVSGLHVPWNMQLLSNSRNAEKRNRLVA